MLTMPSSSASARQQQSPAMLGRPHSVVSGLDPFMQRADGSAISRAPAMLSTPDVSSQPAYGSYGLRVNEQALGFGLSAARVNEHTPSFGQPTARSTEQALGYGQYAAPLSEPSQSFGQSVPDSVLTRSDSLLTGMDPLLSRHDSGYLPRQLGSIAQQSGPDESQQAMSAMHTSLLLPGKVVSHHRTASTPSLPRDSMLTSTNSMLRGTDQLLSQPDSDYGESGAYSSPHPNLHTAIGLRMPCCTTANLFICVSCSAFPAAHLQQLLLRSPTDKQLSADDVAACVSVNGLIFVHNSK